MIEYRYWGKSCFTFNNALLKKERGDLVKYSKPTIEVERFDVADVITASDDFNAPDTSNETGPGIELSVGDFDFQGDFVF